MYEIIFGNKKYYQWVDPEDVFEFFWPFKDSTMHARPDWEKVIAQYLCAAPDDDPQLHELIDELNYLYDSVTEGFDDYN